MCQVPGCLHSDEYEIRDFNVSKLLIIVSNSRLGDCLGKRAIKVTVLQLEESNPILNFECSGSSELGPQRDPSSGEITVSLDVKSIRK